MEIAKLEAERSLYHKNYYGGESRKSHKVNYEDDIYLEPEGENKPENITVDKEDAFSDEAERNESEKDKSEKDKSNKKRKDSEEEKREAKINGGKESLGGTGTNKPKHSRKKNRKKYKKIDGDLEFIDLD